MTNLNRFVFTKISCSKFKVVCRFVKHHRRYHGKIKTDILVVKMDNVLASCEPPWIFLKTCHTEDWTRREAGLPSVCRRVGGGPTGVSCALSRLQLPISTLTHQALSPNTTPPPLLLTEQSPPMDGSYLYNLDRLHRRDHQMPSLSRTYL